jgi:PAS domain S-box-containing protein
VLRRALTPLIGADDLPFLTFFPSLFLAAWFLGTGPTLLATLLGALSAGWLFLPPHDRLTVGTPVGAIGIAFFAAIGIAVAFLSDREQRARRLAVSRAGESERLRADLAAVVEQLPVGLVMRSAEDGRVLLSNSRMRALFGREPVEDMRPEHLAELAGALRRLDGSPVVPEALPIPLVFRTGEHASDELECTHPDGRRVILHLEASPVRDASGRVTAGILTLADVTERWRSEQALHFLAEASAAVGSSLDYETTLRTVARLAVPTLADWCVVDLVQRDGSLRRIAVVHTDPAREAWAHELERRFPADPARDDGPYRVLRTGEPAFVPEITPEMFERSARDPEYIRLVRELGLSSYISVPLAAHGQVFGVLSLIMSDVDSRRRYSTADLRLATALGQRAGAAVDNARRHRAAVESANMLDAVLAASPVGQAFVDRDLRYVHVNRALAALHGVPVAEHIGRRISEVLPAWGAQLEPVHREVFETARSVVDREFEVPAPGGGIYQLLVTIFPVRDAAGEVRWVGSIKDDVTGLRVSEGRLRRVLESPLIGIGFYHRDGRITSCNRSLADLLGYTPEEVEAGALRWDTNFTAPEFRHLDAQAAREVAATGASRPFEKELIRRDGSRVPVLAGASRLDADGRTGVFFILDLTERRRVEEQAQAAQRLEAVGRLAGGVAHEINNALQGVLGFNAFILNRLDRGDPARADAEQVQRSGERAARIAQQLLAYSRRQLLQQVDIDLRRLVNDFSPMLRQALGPDRSLLLDPSGGEAVVHADRAQLEQVLLNLTLNARDAMPDGGTVTIRVDRQPVTATWAAAHGVAPGEGSLVRLTVADTGTGMDPLTRARIFEPFFTTKAVGEGTGLGLSVVHGIVQQSGGHVWVDSEPGRGTVVNVLLPAVADAVPASPPMRTAERRAPLGNGETILVVDDEPVVLEFADSVLRNAGYRVLAAVQAEQALRMLAAEGDDVALVLTDLVMPGMGGRALGEALARVAAGVPVLYCSGYTGDEVTQRGLIAEGADFIQKPFTPEELLQRIRVLLDRSGRPAARSGRRKS